ncbi:MAG: hypothetical protein ACPL28_08145 [bacterium]
MKQMIKLTFLTIIFNYGLCAKSITLIEFFGGQIYWSNYSACVGGGFEYHLSKIAFLLPVSYQSYEFVIPKDEIPPAFDSISYEGWNHEISIGLGFRYIVADIKGFKLSCVPKAVLLLSGGEIRSDGIIPGELIEKYGCNKLFLSVNPGIGAHYNIPKTNLWLGTEFNYSHHFNYAKEQNNYFTLIFSFAFELLRR